MSEPAVVDGWETLDSPAAPPPADLSPREAPAAADAPAAAPDADGFEVDGPSPQTADDAVEQERQRREAAEAEAEAGATKDDKAGEKKSKPLTQRVEKEYERLKQARFERGQEERRLAQLRQEIADLEAKRTAPPAAGETAVPDEKPKWADYDAAGKTWDEYIDAKDAWDAAQIDRRLEARKREELQQAERAHAERVQRAAAAEIAARIDAARSAHEDFDEVIEALADIEQEKAPFLRDAITTHDQGGEIMYYLAVNAETVAKPLVALHQRGALTYPMMDALRETSRPTEFLGYLAANPTEAERIARLSPASALVALGRIVSKLEDAPAGSSAPARPKTKAVPPPAARVDGSRSVAGQTRDADDGIAWDMS